MTLLVTCLAVDDMEEVRRLAGQAWARGAEAVELRLDTFRDSLATLAEYLAAHKERTWIITCRAADEGGRASGDADERLALLTEVARGCGGFVDFEWAHWRKATEQGRRKLLDAAADSPAKAPTLILSTHDFSGVPLALTQIVETMRVAREAAVVKVAFQGHDISDNFPALDLMHRLGNRAIAVCMGEAGLISRVLAKKLGAWATYCSLSPEANTAPGQASLRQMLELYRFDRIDESTRVFGVIGNPVAHSMSPLLHNHWFARHGINAVFLPLMVDSEQALRSFLDGCLTRPWLDVGGFSVTMPHKMGARRWVGTGAGATAVRTGVVNTLVFTAGKKATGYNTDSDAAIDSMTDALGCARNDLAGLSVDVLGTGGVARAVIAGLKACGCKVTVFGRSAERTLHLAKEFEAEALPWEKRTARRGELLVNCTNIGMWPTVDESPMPADAVVGRKLVYDVIYNPLETKLLRDAASAGTPVLGGLDMFVRQAAKQLEYWTGVRPDIESARQLVTQEILDRQRQE